MTDIETISSLFSADPEVLKPAFWRLKKEYLELKGVSERKINKKEWERLCDSLTTSTAALREKLFRLDELASSGLYSQPKMLMDGMGEDSFVETINGLVKLENLATDLRLETQSSPQGWADNYLVKELVLIFYAWNERMPTFSDGGGSLSGELPILLKESLPYFGISSIKVGAFANRYKDMKVEISEEAQLRL
ncbi:MAG: hypothetical protein M3H12_13845 [Chromatiales bacterium]|nr:hypothetical protein [Gammaproteobacteria bacterium]